MISINNRIQAFVSLGKLLLAVGSNNIKGNKQVEKLNKAVVDSVNYNGWFIEDNVRYMFASIGNGLTEDNIDIWITSYKKELLLSKEVKTIGVVMAGNVPVVGFHDFLSILISGNKVLAKLSSDDNKLLPIIAELLIEIEPGFANMIEFTDGRLTGFDAIIATGSNNTSRYFEYYFGKYPNIIRKNRNSVALLTGDETDDELQGLSKDIFMYYGLGCRNISHILIPENYNFDRLFKVIERNEEIVKNHKYFNNYEYNKAIYLVNGKKHFDTGNLLITEDGSFSSPVSVLHYSYYKDIDVAGRFLEVSSSQIQCIVTASNVAKNAVVPGNSQFPELWDYADGVDTMQFLTEL